MQTCKTYKILDSSNLHDTTIATNSNFVCEACVCVGVIDNYYSRRKKMKYKVEIEKMQNRLYLKCYYHTKLADQSYKKYKASLSD